MELRDALTLALAVVAVTALSVAAWSVRRRGRADQSRCPQGHQA